MSAVLPNDLSDAASGAAAAARLNLAELARRAGAFGEAETHLRAALTAPGTLAIARNNLAAALAGQGRWDEATPHWVQAYEAAPTDPVPARNLALALGRAGDAAAGLAVVEAALASAPADAGLLVAKFRLLFQLGEPRDGVAALIQAIESDRAAVRAEFPGGGKVRVLSADDMPGGANWKDPSETEQERWQSVIRIAEEHTEETLKRTIEHNPQDYDAYLRLARLYQSGGREEQAITVLRQVLELVPDHPAALHKLEVLTGQLMGPRVPDQYISALFDSFADTFDKVLASLDYQAPALALDALSRHGLLDRTYDVLELGCGTGLFGTLIRPHAARLVGLDLSPGMLAKARERGIYDELIEAELTGWLAATDRRAGLVATTDVLCYVAHLDPIFVGVARVLEPGGTFVCTVEQLHDDEGADAVKLRHHGRYSHHETHVRSALAAAGLDLVAIERGRLRNEASEEVDGLIVVARKPEGTKP